MEQPSNLPVLHSATQLATRTNNRVSLLNLLLKEREATYWHEKGLKHLQLEEWEGAAYCFDNAIKRDANTASYYVLKALASSYLKNVFLTSDALYEGFKAHEDFQDFIAAISKEKWEYILSFLIENKKDHSSVVCLLFSIGICQIVTKNLLECVDTVESLKYIIDEPNKEFYLLNGVLQFYLKNYEQCIDEINKVIKLDERTALAFNLIGLAYQSLHKYVEAIDYFTRSMNINPNYYHAYANRARSRFHSKYYVYEALGSSQDIIKDCNKALALKPQVIDLYNTRAKAYIQLGDFENALKSITAPIEFAPENYYPYYLRGQFHGNQKQYESAIIYYTKSIELNPEHSLSYSERASSHRCLNNSTEAINDLSRAIDLKKGIKNYGNDSLYSRRGDIKASIKDFTGAIEDYTEAIQLKNHHHYYFSRGIAKANLNDNQGAIDDYSKAIEHNRFYNNTLKLNVLPELKLDQNLILAFYYRGLNKEKLKDYTEALSDYETVLMIVPDHKDALNAKCRITAKL